MTGLTTRDYVYYVGGDPADLAAATQALATSVDVDISASLPPMMLSTFGDLGSMAALGTGTNVPGAANRAVCAVIKAREELTPLKFVWWNTVQNGNYDVAVYDNATGNRLWSKGSTACPAAGEHVEVVAGLTLQPGVEYVLGFAADNNTVSIRSASLALSSLGTLYDGSAGVFYVAGSFPFPAVLGARTAGTVFPALALRA